MYCSCNSRRKTKFRLTKYTWSTCFHWGSQSVSPKNPCWYGKVLNKFVTTMQPGVRVGTVHTSKRSAPPICDADLLLSPWVQLNCQHQERIPLLYYLFSSAHYLFSSLCILTWAGQAEIGKVNFTLWQKNNMRTEKISVNNLLRRLNSELFFMAIFTMHGTYVLYCNVKRRRASVNHDIIQKILSSAWWNMEELIHCLSYYHKIKG